MVSSPVAYNDLSAEDLDVHRDDTAHVIVQSCLP